MGNEDQIQRKMKLKYKEKKTENYCIILYKNNNKQQNW